MDGRADDLMRDAELAQRVRGLGDTAKWLGELAALREKGAPGQPLWATAGAYLDDAWCAARGALVAVDSVARGEDPSARRGDWIGTFSGVQFWPLDPRPEEVRADDVAHALWNKCRWAGMCSRFYSVGEHSMRAAWGAGVLAREAGLARELIVLTVDATLLHDGAEAYLPDVPTPVKAFLAGWDEIEAAVQQAVNTHFGLGTLPAEVVELVERADRYMRVLEARALFSPEARKGWGPWMDDVVPETFAAAAFGFRTLEDPARWQLTATHFEAELIMMTADAAARTRASYGSGPQPAPVSAQDFEPPAHLKRLLEGP